MARTYLDFERPIAELDSQIEAALAEGKDVSDLEAKAKAASCEGTDGVRDETVEVQSAGFKVPATTVDMRGLSQHQRRHRRVDNALFKTVVASAWHAEAAKIASARSLEEDELPC